MKIQKLTLLFVIIVSSLICFGQRASRDYMDHIKKTSDLFKVVEKDKSSKAVLLNESFEGDWPPEGWTTYELGDVGYWDQRLDFGNTGNYCAYHDEANGNTHNWLVSPQMFVDDLDYQLTLYGFASGPNPNECNVMVSTGSSNPEDGDYQQVLTFSGAGWFELLTVDLSVYDQQNIYIGFQMIGNLVYPWYIDDIYVAPTSFADGGIEITSPMGYSPNTGTEDVIVSINNYGTGNITSYDIEWWVNGEQQITYSGTSTIFPGYPETKTIGTYDFDEEGNYTIETHIVIIDDEDPTNDNSSVLYSVGLSSDLSILEFMPSNNSPNAGMRDIVIDIKNNGTAYLFEFDVEWSINSIAQAVFSASGLNIAPGEIINLNIGEYDFQEGIYEIEISIPIDFDLNPDDNEIDDVYAVGGLFEDFQGDYPPNLWQVNYSLKSTFSPQGNDPSNFYAETWGGTTSFGAANDTTWTPILDIEAGDELTFMGMTPMDGGIHLIWKDSQTGEINVLAESLITPPYFAWEEFTVDLTPAAGHSYVGFVNIGDGGFTVTNYDDVYSSAPIFTYDNDLLVQNLDESLILMSETEEKITCSVLNIGDMDVDGSEYTIKLMDTQLGELTSIQGVDFGTFEEKQIEIPHTFITIGEYNIYVEIEYVDDENLSNNVTSVSRRSVVPFTSEFPTIGSPDYAGLEFPFNFTAVQGYPYGIDDFSQILYYSDEIGTPGVIYGIKYYYTNVAAYGGISLLKTWIAETEETEFTGAAWHPQEEFQMVFDGTVETTGDDGYIYIPFDEPYVYDGTKNIIVQSLAEDASYIFAVSYISATISTADVRVNTLWDWHAFDLNNLPFPYGTRTDYPYTTFVVDPMEDIGIISGVVYDENNDPIVGATITVEGTTLETTAGPNGIYSLPLLSYGEHTIKVDQYGYDYIFETVNLSEPTYELDFYLEFRPEIQLTGNVVGSNDNLVPLENVNVEIDGYENYSSSTNSVGDFALNNVYGNEFYQIKLELYGYETYIDTIELTDINLDIGTLVMQEDFICAVNVFAEDNESHVSLDWTDPVQSEELYIVYDMNEDLGGLTNEPYEEVWLGNRFTNPGTTTLTDVDIFFTWNEGGTPDSLKVDIFNQAGEIIATSEPFMTPLGAWVNLDLPNMTITGDYYIMVHWRDNEYSTHFLSFDFDWQMNMENAAYIKFPNEALITLKDFMASYYPQAFLIRAKALGENSDKGAKEALSYNIYRGLADDISDVNQWEMINSEPVLETSFIDDTWPPTPVDNYMYAIEAIYTEADAEVTFSNSILGGTNVSIFENQTNVKIFPNPVTDNFVIQFDALITGIEIFNSHGQVLLSNQEINDFSYQVNVKDFDPGIYYLKLETSTGWLNKKIIKL